LQGRSALESRDFAAARTNDDVDAGPTRTNAAASLPRSVTALTATVFAVLASACAPLEPMPPVVAYKTGLTITIRNPFDCNEQTELICSDGNLDLQCRCRPAGRTAERSSLVHELQALVDAHDAADR
jgi:hypothetical protein